MARKRNRKKEQDKLIFPAPLACVLGLAAVVSLTYLGFCGRCEAIGAHIKVLENRKEAIHRQVVNEEFKWSYMTSLDVIDAQLRRFNINMSWPEDGQVKRLRRPDRWERPVRLVDDTRQYAQSMGIAMHD